MAITIPPTRHIWTPQPGPQVFAYTCPCDEIFLGGTRGGGKSDCGIGRQIGKAERYGRYHNGIMVRRKYKDFAGIRQRWDELIAAGLPAHRRVGGEQQVNYIRFHNGATVTLQAILHLKQADDLQGNAFTEITIDEAPLIPFISQLIDRLKGTRRSSHGVPSQMFLTGNPGGPGASQISAMYIGKEDGGRASAKEHEAQTLEYKMEDGRIAQISRVFIRSRLQDNKILLANDPNYEAVLRSMHDPLLVKAWLDGRWDVFIGQAFDFHERHIIEPIWPIPSYVPIYMTMDWGFGAPAHIGWWWVDSDDRIYLAAEWYTCQEGRPNIGLRLTDPELAEGIIEREKEMNIWGREVTRLAGPDCFNKKPDYKGGGQGDTTNDDFQRVHPSLALIPGDPKRQLKIKQFRNRLRVPSNPSELPMLVVYNTCESFISIIPQLCVDELTGEYLEKGQELHPFDSACHICMARPQGIQDDYVATVEREKDWEKQVEGLDNVSREASKEFDKIIEEKVKMQEGFWDDIFF